MQPSSSSNAPQNRCPPRGTVSQGIWGELPQEEVLQRATPTDAAWIEQTAARIDESYSRAQEGIHPAGTLLPEDPEMQLNTECHTGLDHELRGSRFVNSQNPAFAPTRNTIMVAGRPCQVF